jgi:vacuolar-type H+-ATPase subunit I/STV1
MRNLIRAPQYLPAALAFALLLFALVFSRVAYDLATGNHDNLFVFCAVLAALSFISAILTGIVIWQTRSRGR